MPTELAQPPVRVPTSRMYMSRRSGLRLVVTPRYDTTNAGGQRGIGAVPGCAVQFRNGRFDLPLEGDVTVDQGRTFPVEAIAEALESHRLLRDLQDGFWPVDVAAPPVSQEELDAIVEAAMTFDLDALEAIRDTEVGGWERPQIINAAEKAISKMNEIAERHAAEVEAAKAKPSTGKAKIPEPQEG